MEDTGADISTVQKCTVEPSSNLPYQAYDNHRIYRNFGGSTVGQVCGLLEAAIKHDSNQIRAATLYIVTDDMPAVVGQTLELLISGHNLQVTGDS